MATVPAGKKFFEAPASTVKTPQYRDYYLNTLILSKLHFYHPIWFEPIKVHYQDMIQRNNSFEVNHTGQIKKPII